MTPYGFPADVYHCLLDEQPHYLVPSRLLPEQGAPDMLIVNPASWFSWMAPLPPSLAARMAHAENLYPGEWMVWVEDAGTNALWPYWMGSEFATWCSGLIPGQPLDTDLPDNVRSVLWQAGVLVELNHGARRRQQWLAQLSKFAPAFERGYVAIPGLIPAFHLGALRRYLRARTRIGAFPFFDDAGGKRFICQDEGAARFLQHQLTTAISDVARTVLLPAFCEAVCFQSNSQVETQTGGEQCDYTVTLCVDATPEPEAQSPWPLQFNTTEGRLKLWQYLGDALAYRGRYIPIAREPLPQGHTSSSLIFHFGSEAPDPVAIACEG